MHLSPKKERCAGYFDDETERKVSCEVLWILLFKQFMAGLFQHLFSNY